MLINIVKSVEGNQQDFFPQIMENRLSVIEEQTDLYNGQTKLFGKISQKKEGYLIANVWDKDSLNKKLKVLKRSRLFKQINLLIIPATRMNEKFILLMRKEV